MGQRLFLSVNIDINVYFFFQCRDLFGHQLNVAVQSVCVLLFLLYRSPDGTEVLYSC